MIQAINLIKSNYGLFIMIIFLHCQIINIFHIMYSKLICSIYSISVDVNLQSGKVLEADPQLILMFCCRFFSVKQIFQEDISHFTRALVDRCSDASLKHHLQNLWVRRDLMYGRVKLGNLFLNVLNGNLDGSQNNLKWPHLVSIYMQCNSRKSEGFSFRSLMEKHINHHRTTHFMTKKAVF